MVPIIPTSMNYEYALLKNAYGLATDVQKNFRAPSQPYISPPSVPPIMLNKFNMKVHLVLKHRFLHD